MDFDSVRAEKEDAMRRYNRHRNLKTFVRIATLFSLLLLLFSCSSPQIPAAMEIVGEFFRYFKYVLCRRQYVFLLMNALVLAIYFSNHKNADVAHPELYDEHISKSASAAADLHSCSPVTKIVNTTNAFVVVTDCSAPVTEREIKVTETFQRYRRSQWQSLERRTVRRELRRSETENGREKAVGRHSMEEMSSEEFRIIVESFIAKKKRDLRGTRYWRSHSDSGVAEL